MSPKIITMVNQYIKLLEAWRGLASRSLGTSKFMIQPWGFTGLAVAVKALKYRLQDTIVVFIDLTASCTSRGLGPASLFQLIQSRCANGSHKQFFPKGGCIQFFSGT